ncbi:MAG: DUF3137 domain-containing protein [Planctomycetota bacterium]|jgi:hypothetical protein
MKTLDDLKRFYETTLAADLNALENKRRAILRKLAYVGACIAIPPVIFLLFSGLGSGSFLPAMIFPPVIAVVIFAFVAHFLSKGYVIEFKSAIIQKILRFIDENLSYYPNRCIPRSTFMASEIFKTRPNRYKGDDYVTGKVDATQIEFSELRAEYESGTGKNKSRRTVFKGLFFNADFNKHFTCRVVVLPDTAEKLFGGFGKILQSWNLTRDQLIKLEDPEFERYFAVYGNDQIQTRYVLSTSLMARIVDFKKKTNRKIYLSFVGSRVFVAVSYTKNLFEPRLFRTILDFDLVQEYFEDLQLAIGIVDDLSLNTRIWSKA